MSATRLNLAGMLAKTFIESRLTLLFLLACGVLGAVAVTQSPREENPQIIVPGAEIIATLPGASATEIEQLVVNPLEAIVAEIPGIDHTYAAAMNSIGILNVQFNVGEDKEKSLVKLHDRIMGQRDRLPDDVSLPIIRTVDVDDVPIVTVTLASEHYDDYALKRISDRMIERLRSIEAVSVAYVKGGRDREIRIELDPERLQAFDISFNTARSLITASNVAAPIGTLVQKGYSHDVFLNGYLQSADAVRGLIVGSHLGRPIYLEDVADVFDSPPQERDSVSRFAFGSADSRYGTTHSIEIPAVTLAVSKKPGSNAVDVADDILDRVARMQRRFVPQDVHVVVTRNDGQKADDSVKLLIEHLGIAIFSVFMVTLLFLGLKEALVVGLSVPLILALTLGADYLFGPTINRVTLFALILSLGLLVDAAIVVIENIHRHYKSLGSADAAQAAIMATNEIGNATNLATVAVMVVFASMIVLTGMPASYFFPITFNVPIAMLASLVVAYIVTPWAANRWLKPDIKKSQEQHSSNSRSHRFYVRAISLFLDSSVARWLLLVSVIVMIIASSLQPAWQFIRPQGVGGPLSAGGVALGMLPKDDKNTFNITLDMPEHTPIEVTDRVVRELGQPLLDIPTVLNYQSWIGQAGVIDFNGLLRGSSNKQGPHVAEIRVNLVPKHARSTSSIDIVQALRPAVTDIQARYPGSVIQLVEDPPGPPVRATVLAEIYGSDPEIRRALSATVSEAFSQTYDMVDVTDTEAEDVRQFRLTVDKEKAALSGITTAEIAAVLRQLIEGEELGRIHIDGEKNAVPIRLKVPQRHQLDPERLSRVFISNPRGMKIPVSEVVKTVPASRDRTIYHKDYEPVTFVGGELGHTSPVYAVLDLNQRLSGIPAGDGTRLKTGNLQLRDQSPDTIDGYQLLWGGEMRMTLDIYRDLGNAMLLALLFMYLLLVGHYQSFGIPLVAMAAIPLGLVGVFPGHWLMGQVFTGPSIIGILALAGAVVRNSLLIIDFVFDNLNRGMSLHEAVREAGAVRLRPILLTALAIILGTAVMLSDAVFGGLAISLIFGTIASTVLTLLVVPVLLFMLLSFKQRNALSTESEHASVQQ